MAMVKANAYGHGILPIAQNLSKADYFGVACLEEAIALRNAGIKQAIVLMSGFHAAEELDVLLSQQIQPVVYDWQQLELLNRLPTAQNLKVWLKIDTGMHRLGFPLVEAERAWQYLKASEIVDNITVMTHFAGSNRVDDPLMVKQQQRFIEATRTMGGLRSAANSAALMQYPETRFDIVRPGLMLYGVSPRDGISAKADDLLPVMTLKSRVISIHTIEPGETVGYSATWTAARTSRIATVSIGYGDGYPQCAPNGTPVKIHGKIVPLAGRVSMDTLTIDVTDVPKTAVGDEVILWGDSLPVEQVAEAMKASMYGLLTGVTARVRRSLVSA